MGDERRHATTEVREPSYTVSQGASMSRLRTAAKWGAWLLGVCALVLAVWFGINATDEPLSDDARAALTVAPLPAPDRDNGFLDFLVLTAPAEVPAYEAGLERLKAINNQSGTGSDYPEPPWGSFKADTRLRNCSFGADGSGDARGCFDLATREPWVQEALEAQATLVKRYRVMREKPHFASLIDVKSPEDPLPAYQELLEGDRLVLLGAARRFHAGERREALRELEREAAFYRRMARDANNLIEKMIAFAALDRVALFVAEVARHAPRGDEVVRRGLSSTLVAPTKEELDLAPAFAREMAKQVEWMRTRRYIRMSDATWKSLEQWSDERRPWWEPVRPYLYRPHQATNWYVASCRILDAVRERPSTEYFKASDEARARLRELAPGPITRVVFNPAGWRHPLFGTCESADYFGRAHGRAGVQTLVRLLVNLRAMGITQPQDVAAALAGPLGQAHTDPFTGKPMRFDPQTATIGFEVEAKLLSGVTRPIRERYGRMALPL